MIEPVKIWKNIFTGWLQGVVNRNPVFTHGLHAHILAVMFRQPFDAIAQVTGKGGKPLAYVGGDTLVVCGSDARDKKRSILQQIG